MNKTAPSVSFEKFWETIKNFSVTGIPDKPINSEYFESYKTPNKYLLVTAYQFFDLLTANYQPTDRLRRLIFSGLDSNVFQGFVVSSYSELFETDILQIDKNTLYQILNERYNLKNDSAIKKGMSFFKQACDKAKIELSDKLSDRSGISAKPISNENEQEDETSDMETQNENINKPPEKNSANFVNTIILTSGGKLTLSAEVDVWKLNKDDRELVFTLVDAMNEYENR